MLGVATPLARDGPSSRETRRSGRDTLLDVMAGAGRGGHGTRGGRGGRNADAEGGQTGGRDVDDVAVFAQVADIALRDPGRLVELLRFEGQQDTLGFALGDQEGLLGQRQHGQLDERALADVGLGPEQQFVVFDHGHQLAQVFAAVVLHQKGRDKARIDPERLLVIRHQDTARGHRLEIETVFALPQFGGREDELAVEVRAGDGELVERGAVVGFLQRDQVALFGAADQVVAGDGVRKFDQIDLDGHHGVGQRIGRHDHRRRRRQDQSQGRSRKAFRIRHRVSPSWFQSKDFHTSSVRRRRCRASVVSYGHRATFNHISNTNTSDLYQTASSPESNTKKAIRGPVHLPLQ